MKVADGSGAAERAGNLQSWLTTTNHARIASIYGALMVGSLLVAGALGLVLRVEHLDPDTTVMNAGTFHRVFTLHGTMMIFLVAPGLMTTFGNFLLPKMLGADDLAYPRLNRFCVRLFAAAAIAHVALMCSERVGTGWTFYSPYSANDGAYLALLPVLAVGLSLILTAVNFISTIRRRSAGGPGLAAMPHFVWSLYGSSFVLVLCGLPALLALLAVVGAGLLDIQIAASVRSFADDPVLGQVVLGAYARPLIDATCVLVSSGVMLEALSVHGRRDMVGFRGFIPIWAIVLANLIGALGPAGGAKWLGLIQLLCAVSIYYWVSALCAIDLHRRAIGWYLLSYLWLLIVNGFVIRMTDLLGAMHLVDTYVVIGVFHLSIGSSLLLSILTGLHHWWPKITGKMFDERAAKVGAAMLLTGLAVTFMTQVVMGFNGLPRRYYDYLPEYTTMHRISTIGALFLGLAVLWISFYLLRSLRTGPAAPENPWAALSLEWRGASDPGDDAVTRGPYDFPEVERESLKGGGVGG